MNLENIENKERESDFYKLFATDMCRVCLAGENLESLFTENNIIDLFTSCTALEVSFEDQYPKHICDRCLIDLHNYFDFWKKCRNSLDELDKIKESLDDSSNFVQENTDVASDTDTDIRNNFEPLNINLKSDDDLNSCSNCGEEYTGLNHICTISTKFCKHCEIYFEDDDKLYKHTLKYHSTNPPYACDVCPKAYKFAHSLKLHKNTHIEERPYTCPICSKSYKSNKDLTYHKHIHLNEKKYCCTLCDKGFNKPYLLKQHIVTHTNYKCEYPCTICNKILKSKSGAYAHSLLHKAEKRYKCDQCDRSFSTWHSRRGHIKSMHTDERPYLCRMCPMSFKFSNRLTIHERQHTGEKPYKCTQCTMAFVSSGRLKMHMLKHTGERKHPCPYCNKKFPRPQHVKQHLVTHTKERNHKCEICGKAFTQAHVLKSHMKVHVEEVEEFEIDVERCG